MQVCTVCGEVYADDVSTCPLDGEALREWAETQRTNLAALHEHLITAPEDSVVTAVDAVKITPSELATPILDQRPRVGQLIAERYELGTQIGIGGYGDGDDDDDACVTWGGGTGR